MKLDFILSQGKRRFYDERFGPETARRVRAFHQSFPGYEPTPLFSLKELSSHLGVGGIFVKDESRRFGLGAFKVLGGSYCMGRYICERLGRQSITYEEMVGEEASRTLGDLKFVTATDGNHGRGVAWAAHQIGRDCVVYLPRGSAEERRKNIEKLGAEASIVDMDYDEAVELARRMEEEKGWVLMQDTSWPGYEKIPTWIMQGYTTMALEAVEQLGDTLPTHVFLQAGVGSMAGAVAAFLASYYGEKRPYLVIVEPTNAACLYETARAADGRLHQVSANGTIMAGLCCGKPCSLAWELLEQSADCFVRMGDEAAARGMRVLSSPLGKDPRIVSGESGASTMGLLYSLLSGQEALRERLGLGEDSQVLLFSTEGDTDPEGYRRVVWDGAYPWKEGNVLN